MLNYDKPYFIKPEFDERIPQPNYMLCSKSDLDTLIPKAESEALQLMKDLRPFYIGDFGINIYPVEHVMGWSVAADLVVAGEVCRTEDPADLLFLELNELIINKLLQIIHLEQPRCNEDDE